VHELYLDHCLLYSVISYPVSWYSLSTFAVSLEGLKPSTVRQYLAAVKTKHKLMGYDLDAQLNVRLEQLLRGLENESAEHNDVKPVRPAISSELIVSICSRFSQIRTLRVDHDTASAAAVVFGFLFLLRASSLASVNMSDVTASHDKLSLNLRNRKSKQSPQAKAMIVPISRCEPAQALAKYLQAASAVVALGDSPFLFDKHKSPNIVVNDAIRTTHEWLGLSLQDTPPSHSLRRGGAVSMFAVGVLTQRILSWGSWESETSLRPYIKDRAWCSATHFDSVCFSWMLST